jgi:hypothetical protein
MSEKPLPKAPSYSAAKADAGCCLTPVLLRSQTDALELATRLYKESKVICCAECNGLGLRAKATALVQLVVKIMEDSNQKGSPQYNAAIKLKAACEATYPACSAGGFAMTAVDVIYTKCVRKQPLAKSLFGPR